MPMPWPLITFLLLGFGLFRGTGAAHGENAPPAQIAGTVLCAPCFNRGFSRSSNFISGASVLIECTDLGFRKEVTTDERGKYEVHLPPSTSEDAKKMQGCTVKLIKSSNPGCDAVSSRASLRLKLNRQQPQALSVGTLAFTPQDQPSSCARKPTWRGPLRSGSKKGSIHPESASRALKPSNYPVMTPVTSPPVLGSTTLPPWLPFPPSQRPLPVPLPPFWGSPPPLPQPPLPYFPPFPPTPGATLPSPSIVSPFPPLTEPPIASSPRPASRPPTQASAPPPPIPFPFPIPPLPAVPPTLPFPLPPTQASAPPPSTPFPFPIPPLPAVPPTLPFPLPPTQASAPPPIPFPFPLPRLPACPPALPFPLPLIPASAPPPPTPSR